MIKFRKPYAKLVEGQYDFAIVSYAKVPHLQKTTTIDEGHFTSGHTYIAQYRKRLKIDLWLFVLAFEWKTREVTK